MTTCRDASVCVFVPGCVGGSAIEHFRPSSSDVLRLASGCGVVGFVAHSKDAVNVRDAMNDPRVDPDEQRRLGVRAGPVLTLPIISPSGFVYGVLQVRQRSSWWGVGRLARSPVRCFPLVGRVLPVSSLNVPWRQNVVVSLFTCRGLTLSCLCRRPRRAHSRCR